MSDQVALSKGAMRAAELVAAEYERARNFGRSASPSHDKLAEMIDRETKSPQMAALLRQYHERDAKCGGGISCECTWHQAERLLSELEVKP